MTLTLCIHTHTELPHGTPLYHSKCVYICVCVWSPKETYSISLARVCLDLWAWQLAKGAGLQCCACSRLLLLVVLLAASLVVAEAAVVVAATTIAT